MKPAIMNVPILAIIAVLSLGVAIAVVTPAGSDLTTVSPKGAAGTRFFSERKEDPNTTIPRTPKQLSKRMESQEKGKGAASPSAEKPDRAKATVKWLDPNTYARDEDKKNFWEKAACVALEEKGFTFGVIQGPAHVSPDGCDDRGHISVVRFPDQNRMHVYDDSTSRVNWRNPKIRDTGPDGLPVDPDLRRWKLRLDTLTKSSRERKKNRRIRDAKEAESKFRREFWTKMDTEVQDGTNPGPQEQLWKGHDLSTLVGWNTKNRKMIPYTIFSGPTSRLSASDMVGKQLPGAEIPTSREQAWEGKGKYVEGVKSPETRKLYLQKFWADMEKDNHGGTSTGTREQSS